MSDSTKQPKDGDLRVWWISNPPHKGIKVPVSNNKEAILVLDALAKNDLRLGDLVDCNAGGLEQFEDGEWCEYYDENGQDIREIENELNEKQDEDA